MLARRDESLWFDIVNNTLLAGIALTTIVPFLYIIAGSFTTAAELSTKGFVLFPTVFTMDAYNYIFSTNTIVHSMGISMYVTAMGTFINLAMTALMAYPLARKDLDGRRFFMIMVIFTLLFNGGMIPTYLIVKGTGLLNTLWSVMIPVAISPFYLVITKNFFQQLPSGLEESAKIDGCNDLRIFLRIVLPLSKPVLATFALFYAVAHWNTFFTAVIYIDDPWKWPVQVWLRQIVILSQGGFTDVSATGDMVPPPPQSIKMAVILVATLPILLVYPFLQKHFAKGILLGSIKG